jgi:hypothetical protein
MKVRVNKKEKNGLKQFDHCKLDAAALRAVKGGVTVYYINGVVYVVV